jgi:hypothetical protein
MLYEEVKPISKKGGIVAIKVTFPVTRPDAVTLPYVDPKLVLQ